MSEVGYNMIKTDLVIECSCGSKSTIQILFSEKLSTNELTFWGELSIRNFMQNKHITPLILN